VHSYGIGGKIG